MRFTLLLLGFVLAVVLVTLVWLAIDNARLRRRINGLDEPELWLPRSERRAHARKLLKREDQEYEQQMIARLTQALQGNQPTKEESER